MNTPEKPIEALIETSLETSQISHYRRKVLIGLALMFGFQFIPPPAPITQVGMLLIGAIAGMVLLVATVDMAWPTFAVIVLFAFHSKDVYPNSIAELHIYDAAERSFGQWITVFIIVMLLLCYALEKAGTLRRIALWFVTRRIAQRGPWTFTFMFMCATLVLGSLIDPVPVVVCMIMCAREIFKAFGFKEGEAWPSMMIASVPYVVSISFAMTPIGHNLPIAVLGMVSSISGEPINMLSYVFIGVPVGLCIFVLMFLYFRLFVKPDMSRFDNIDYSEIEKLRPGKMGKGEMIVAIVSAIVLLCWVVPGFLSLYIPESPVTALFNNLSLLFPAVAAVAFLAMVHIDGKPLLDIAEAAKNVSWTIVFLFGGFLLLVLGMSESSSGIPQWVAMYVAPLIGGFSPFVTVSIMATLGIVVTNLLNNFAVAIVFSTVCTPMVLSMGINPAIIAITIAFAANCAYLSPAAQPIISFAVVDPFCNSKYVFRHGLIIAAISIAACLLLYPLGILFYGA
jgi:sodium-dependent dicarboxylate transporter 2/3/5